MGLGGKLRGAKQCSEMGWVGGSICECCGMKISGMSCFVTKRYAARDGDGDDDWAMVEENGGGCNENKWP